MCKERDVENLGFPYKLISIGIEDFDPRKFYGVNVNEDVYCLLDLAAWNPDQRIEICQ